jgi:hypothetical protein
MGSEILCNAINWLATFPSYVDSSHGAMLAQRRAVLLCGMETRSETFEKLKRGGKNRECFTATGGMEIENSLGASQIV